MWFLHFCELVWRKAMRRSIETTDAILLMGGAILAALFELWIGVRVSVDLPWWALVLSVFGLVLLVRFLLAPYWIYVDFRKKNEELERTLDALETREDIRLSLAELRKKGVELRNRGLALTDKAEVPVWKKEVSEWTERTIGEIDKINRADAELFRTLDWISFPEFQGTLSDHHHKSLRMLSQRLVILKDVVVNYARQAPIR